MRILSPPLSVIEANLFAPSDELMQRWLDNDPSLPAATRAALAADSVAQARRADWETAAAPEPPPATLTEPLITAPQWLQERIQQRVKAQQTRFSPVPTPGQILQVAQPIGPDGPLASDQPYPLAVLISAPTEHRQIWYGWLVAPETDYASDADLVLEDSDGPCDPLAGMAQLWNPVYVYLPSTRGVLAELPPRRLAAAQTLAVDFLTGPPLAIRSEPGVLIQRRTSRQELVLSGPPLGGPDDPRHRYRALYHAAAQLLREPVRLAQTQPTRTERLFERLRRLAEAAGLGLTPAPAPVMGAASEEIQQLGDWLELELLESGDDRGVLTLRVRNLRAAPCRLQIVRQGQVRREVILDAGQPETRLLFEPAPGTELVLLDAAGEQLRWPLAG